MRLLLHAALALPACAALAGPGAAAQARPGAPGVAAIVEAGGRRVPLPDALDEVSGLARDSAGALWAHDDERAAIHRLDPATGRITATRVLGPEPVRGDFEGLAWDGERFHLVTSSGTLVSFAPGTSAEVETWSARETAAGAWCEVEGLAFDPGQRALVMACKTVLDDAIADGLVLLAVDLPPGGTADLGAPLPIRPVLALDRDVLEDAGLPRRLEASGVELHPTRDTWIVVAAGQARVVEVARDGRIVGHARLRRHPQAEGIALGDGGGTLLVADESQGDGARLTVYGGSAAAAGGS